jgi:agmatine deiminase
MIPDDKTNFLYLADTLPKYYHKFYKQFENVLKSCNIEFEFLPRTKDVWAVDYMPLQIEKNKFVQFVYNPSYLQTKYLLKTISDVDSICKNLNFLPKKSNIVLDGGNVTKTTDKVIMCDRVFSENPTIKKKDLIKELENIFQVDELIFIPTHPDDFTGHSDGIIRFYDSKTVLINDYPKRDEEFKLQLHLALRKAKLEYIEIPYNPYRNKDPESAKGEYINYLQMRKVVIVPIFGIKEDDIAVKKFEQLFKGQSVETINGNDLAYDGGIINCITWNIYK